MRNKAWPLRSLLQRTLLLITVVFTVASLIMSAYLIHRNSSRDQNNFLRTTHLTLAEFIKPSINISDYLEVQRLLGLVSKHDSIFAVITNKNDILLSDYTNKNIIDGLPTNKTCKELAIEKVRANSKSWSVHCTEIVDDLITTKEHTHKLISLTKVSSFNLSFHEILMLSLVLLSLFSVFIFFVRKSLINKILKPIEDLSFNISTLKRTPLVSNSTIESTVNAPLEVEHLRNKFNDLLLDLNRMFIEENEKERIEALDLLSRQVAHDIQSPLAALQVIKDISINLPSEVREMLDQSIERIHEISDQLINTNLKISKPQSLESAITEIVNEKLITTGNKDIDFNLNISPSSKNLFFNKNHCEFKRIFSNVINNSVDAISNYGTIAIVSTEKDSGIMLKISDSGCGISKEILPLLMKKGATFNKFGGNGLGLFHAKKTLNEWGGNIEINSKVGLGTEIDLILPRSLFTEKTCTL